MDAARFDRLARALGASVPRRRVLVGAMVGLVGGLVRVGHDGPAAA